MRREQEARSDAQILGMLELRDAGLSAADIGRRLNVSRSAVLGVFHRIKQETEPSKHDGTMPYGWWRAGLASRAEAA